jgi:hypothetical protein
VHEGDLRDPRYAKALSQVFRPLGMEEIPHSRILNSES